jgi:hypothetical protein
MSKVAIPAKRTQWRVERSVARGGSDFDIKPPETGFFAASLFAGNELLPVLPF